MMRTTAIRCGIVVAFAAMSLWAVDGSEAIAKESGKNRGKGQAAATAKRRQAELARAQSQAAAARAVLSAVNAKGEDAWGKLQRAYTTLKESSDARDQAEERARGLAIELRLHEQQLLEEQPDESAYASTSTAVTAIEQELKVAEERALSVLPFRDRLNDAERARDEQLIREIRRDATARDADYQETLADLTRYRKELRERAEVIFRADETWIGLHEELKQARQEAAEAGAQVQGSGLSSLGPKHDIREAEQAVVAAQAALNRAEAKVKLLQKVSKRNVKASSTSRNGNRK